MSACSPTRSTTKSWRSSHWTPWFNAAASAVRSLLASAAEVTKQAGMRRLWLVTTNDNLDALRFYQRRGLRIVDVAPGAVDAARAVKPSTPLTGEYGIPLRDELTLELSLWHNPVVTVTH